MVQIYLLIRSNAKLQEAALILQSRSKLVWSYAYVTINIAIFFAFV